MTCKALERFDVGVYPSTVVSETLMRRLVPWYKFSLSIGSKVGEGYSRVRICRSRCSSLVNDCPQYVQKTILESGLTGHQWEEED
jgi:hypothetical protein